MKHIFLNLQALRRALSCYGGVNRIAPMGEPGGYVVKNTQEALKTYAHPPRRQVRPVPAGGPSFKRRGCPG